MSFHKFERRLLRLLGQPPTITKHTPQILAALDARLTAFRRAGVVGTCGDPVYITAMRCKTLLRLAMTTVLLVGGATHAKVALEQKTAVIGVGEALQLVASGADGARWASANPKVAAAYQNGFIIGLRPGTTRVRVSAADGAATDAAECTVTVREERSPLVDPASLQQHEDNRRFTVDGRLCFGSELNGRRATAPEERENLESNRVKNPKPLRKDRELDWALKPGAEVFDGAGILMGTVPAELDVDGRKIPVGKFNFGMSKVMDGRVFLYGFSIRVKPSPKLSKLIDKQVAGSMATSAWLPLDSVVEVESLLERVGVGKVSLPRLPLEKQGFRITGGNPKQYMTEHGEVRIVKDPNAEPVPSHYLRRTSGTVNIIYSVPGFGLGGQGLDSLLVGQGIVFRPANGAKVFVQPTYYPGKHPESGKVTPMTMTFIYGAAEVKGVEPVYGWVAKEALEPAK